jgi:hypothetical protein
MKIRSSFVLLTFGLIIYGCATKNYHGTSKWEENNRFQIYSQNLNEFKISTDNKKVAFMVYKGSSLTIRNCKRKECSTNSSTAVTSPSSSTTTFQMENFKRKGVVLHLSHPNYDTVHVEIKRRVRYDALAKDIGLSLITYGIPLMVDGFKSDFYQLKKDSKYTNVRFEYSQNFMRDEYKKIANSINPKDFTDWMAKYPKSNMKQTVVNRKDSVELLIALSKGQETAIDEYISTHSGSKFLNEANSIKKEMVAARELFTSACTKNTVDAFEDFLMKYPKSLHNKDAHIKLLDAAEKNALSSKKSEVLLEYVTKYLKPNSEFITSSSLNEKKTKLTNAFDELIVKETVSADPAKAYAGYSDMWKRYVTLINNKEIQLFLGYFSKIDKQSENIHDLLFVKLKEANTLDKQKAWKEKTLNDFPKFDSLDIRADGIRNIFITVLDHQKNGNGMVKLYDVDFLNYYIQNHIGFSRIRNNYTYKGMAYQCLTNVNLEELNYTNGKLNGVCKAYNDKLTDVSITFGSGTVLKDISYFQNGKLVKTTYFPSDYNPYVNVYSNSVLNLNDYSYEFENGVNITLKELDRKNEEGNALLKKEAFTEAISLLESARDNNFPTSLAQNIAFDKSIANAKKLYAAYQKKQEEKYAKAPCASFKLLAEKDMSQFFNGKTIGAGRYMLIEFFTDGTFRNVVGNSYGQVIDYSDPMTGRYQIDLTGKKLTCVYDYDGIMKVSDEIFYLMETKIDLVNNCMKIQRAKSNSDDRYYKSVN